MITIQGGTRKIRGYSEGMGPQGEIEIGPCGRHTRRVQVPEARSSSWVFYLLSSGGKGRQSLPPSNRPAGAKPGSIPGRAANPERGISNRKEVNSLLRCFLSHGLVTHCLDALSSYPARGQSRTTTRSMARGFRAIYGSLSQAAEIPAHNRAYPGSRPGGTTRIQNTEREGAWTETRYRGSRPF